MGMAGLAPALASTDEAGEGDEAEEEEVRFYGFPDLFQPFSNRFDQKLSF